MNALSFYLSTSKYVMQANFADRETWSELYRYLPYLRQALLCCVCRNIVKDPMGPNHKVCQHFVCKECVDKPMTIKPQCSWCKKRECYEDATQLKMVVSCFKKLCEYIMNSPIGRDLQQIDDNGEKDSLINILQEGVDFDDEYVSPPVVPPPKRLFVPLATPSLPDLSKTSDQESKESSPTTTSTTSPVVETHVPEDSVEPKVNKITNKLKRVKKPNRRKIRLKKYKWYTKPKKKLTIRKNVLKEKREPSVDQDENLIDVTSINNVKYEIKNEVHEDSKHERPRLKVKLRKRQENFSGTGYDSESETLKRNYNNEKIKIHIDRREKCLNNMEPSIKKLKLLFGENEYKACKCGRGGTSSQLTCLGQRCPCYVKKLPCIKCKCRGCRNPRKTFDPDTEQVLRSLNSTSDPLIVSL